MKRLFQAIFLILIFISVVVLILRFGSKPLADLLGLKERSGIRIEAAPPGDVLIDGQNVGKTPYQSDQLTVGEHLVELKATRDGGQVLNWQGKVTLNPGAVTVVNRELAESVASSSGEVISLEKGEGAILISTPEGAEVSVDGKVVGNTPLRVDQLSAGEHVFLVGRTGYLKRSIKAASVDGYRLTIVVDLALSEADLTKVVNTQPLQTSQQVTIRQTPTGFLRVRAEPSTSADEVGRVAPGDTLTLLEEVPNWFRVRLSDGKEGYISTTYAQKK